jgi:hypothetical protein
LNLSYQQRISLTLHVFQKELVIWTNNSWYSIMMSFVYVIL